VCWAAFLVTWAAGAYYNAQRGPDDRERRAQVSGLAVGWFAAFACSRAVRAGPWALPFLVCLPLCIFKIRTEEGLMSKEFPEEYARYRRRVPQLVPGLRLLARHGAAG
jgi:hypothetical protein